MNYKTHKIGGICAGSIVVCSILPNPLNTLNSFDFGAISVASLVMAGSIIGSSIPDIDKRGSYISKKLGVVSAIASLAGHRKFFHSPLFIIILSGILNYLALFFNGVYQSLYYSLVIGITFGAISHLLVDSMTVSGIPLLYPITNKKIRIAKFRTKQDEFLVSSILVGVTIFIIFAILKLK